MGEPGETSKGQVESGRSRGSHKQQAAVHEEPGGPRGTSKSQGKLWSQEEPGVSRGTQEEPAGAKGNQGDQGDPGGARRSQEEPGGARQSQGAPRG